MKIAIGSDHAGFELKEELKTYLLKNKLDIIDCGTTSKKSVDYPVFAFSVAKKVSEKTAQVGIIIDGAGIGSSMVANKVQGVRAALCYDLSSAKNAREHNNANVLTLGAGFLGSALAKQIIDVFLSTQCTVDRHLKRVKMIDDLDQGVELKIEESLPNSSKIEEGNLIDLSSEDIARVADRLREMMSSQNISFNDQSKTSEAICGDSACSDCGQCAVKTPETVRRFIDLGVNRISHSIGGQTVPQDIAKFIDHTILKPEATSDQIKKLCTEAREFNFAAVCVNPTFVALAKKELIGTNVEVCTVTGFPLGTHMPEIKSMEARKAIRDGASEIDMVINIGALKSGDFDLVYRDIRMVVEACEDGSAICKVIIEAALLTDDEKICVCELAKKARAHYVKTSTGFGPGGATEQDVALMSRVVQDSGIGVKAAGGIKSYEDAKKMIDAGATRIGASAGIKIVQEAKPITIST